MSGELHLPDLPEVPVSVGRPVSTCPSVRQHWRARLSNLAGTTLPLLIMAVLAAGTWWLVKNAPQPDAPATPAEVRHLPDYQVARFTLQRYAPDGRLQAQIEGEQLRHYPDTDELEIDAVHVLFYHPDGRVTRATAREGLAAADGSRVRLMGGAHVISTGTQGEPVNILGEELVAEPPLRRIWADRPVSVQQGDNELTAEAFHFDEQTGLLQLRGRARAVLTPRPAAPR